MRIFPRRLGPKLNLSLLVFLVLLGAATATLVLLGFRRTQDNATRTSREGLETQAKQTLLLLAVTQSQFGQSQLEATAGFGQQAARYMQDARTIVGATSLDPARLSRNALGATYDPDPNRVTSVYVPPSISVDEKVLRDLRDSAALDAVFPSILAGYKGDTRSANFDAVAIYFNSVNGVTRYFPALPVEQFAASTDPRNMVAAEGPGANPTRATRWTSPYTDKTGRGQVITATIPVYDGDEYRGIIGMDVTLANLAAQIDLVKPSPNGYAFYLDRQGHLFNTASSPTVQAAIDDSANTGFASIISSMKSGEANVGRAEVNGQEVFVGYAPIGDVGGSFALVAPISDVTQQASLVANGIDDQGNRTLAFVLGTMVLFFGAALVGAALLNRRAILRPIEEMVAGTQAVAAGNLTARIPVRSSDELGMLADSFNVMTGEVREARESLEQRVDERTRELTTLLEVARNVGSTLELDRLLHLVLEQVRFVVPHDRAALLIREGNENLRVAAAIGSPDQPAPLTAPGMMFRVSDAPPIWDELNRGRPVIIDDIRSDSPLAMSYRSLLGPLTERALAIVRAWMAAPLMFENRLIGIVILSRGEVGAFTERHAQLTTAIGTQAGIAIENARLFAETEERTRELATLLEVSDEVAATLDLEPLLELILDRLQGVAPYDRAGFLLLEGDELVAHAVAVRDGVVEGQVREQIGMRFTTRESGLWNAVSSGRPVIVDDVRNESADAAAFQQVTGDHFDTVFDRIRSWMAVPVTAKDRVIGLVGLSKEEPAFYTQRHGELAKAISSQAGVGIENARLFRETQERTGELASLLDVARNVASTLELRPLLQLILRQVRSMTHFDRAGIMLRYGDMLRVEAVHTPEGGTEDEVGTLGESYPVGGILWEEISQGQSLIIDDVRADTKYARAYRRITGLPLETVWRDTRSWMGVPIVLKDEVIGMMVMSHTQLAYYTKHHAQVVTAIASQAGIAVENARLFERSERRTRELSALLDISRGIASTLERDPLVATILERLRGIVDYRGASILSFEGDMVRVLDFNRYQLQADGRERRPIVFPRDAAPGFWAAMDRDGSSLVEDIRDGKEGSLEFQRVSGPLFETAFRNVRSFLAVPLQTRDQTIGALALSHPDPGFFSQDQVRLVRAVADQAAVALENARLFEETQQRTRELSALLEVGRNVGSTLELQPLLRLILQQVLTIVPYDRSNIMTFDGDDLIIAAGVARAGVEMLDQVGVRGRVSDGGLLLQTVLAGRPAIIDDIRDDTPLAREYREQNAEVIELALQRVGSLMAVPIMLNDEVVGMMAFTRTEPRSYTSRHAELATAIGSQAGVAIENARLFEETQQSARELTALLNVAQSVASTIELEPLLMVLTEQLRTVIDCYGVTVLTREGDEVTLLDVSNPTVVAPSSPLDSQRVPLAGAIWQAMERGESVVIPDIWKEDDAWARRYRENLGERLKEPAYAAVRSWLAVPLETPDRVGGMLLVSSKELAYFTPQRVALVRGIANQAAVAIENARLFEETQRGARELSGLLDVTQSIASTLDLRKTSGLILDHLKSLVDYSSGSLSIIEDNALGILENRGPLPDEWLTQMRMEGLRRSELPSGLGETADEHHLLDMLNGDVVVIDDIWGDGEVATAFRRGSEASAARAGLSLDPARSLHSYLRIPILAQQRVVGLLVLHHERAGFYTPQRVRLARAVADQAAVAIENARLFEETRRRARETEALFRADEQLFQSLSLDAVFQALVDVCVDVLGVPKSMVTTIEDAEGHYAIRASRNLSQFSLDKMMEIRDSRPRGILADISETIVNADARASIPEMVPVFEAEGIYVTVDVPIKSTGSLRGVLGAAYTSRRTLTPDELRLLQALAERAAVAIDNAELYGRAQQVASLEERQKLARELHDSVSQALYGIALGARTARTLLDRDPAKAIEPVDYVLSLAEAGLTEMRALIFELRPESLESEGLIVAIEKNVAATQARYGIEVVAHLCPEPTAPLDVKEAAYRIAQEALHNIVKHAQASRVDIRLSHEDSTLTLEVRDNGVGFDAGAAFPGHIGLRSMRERTSKSGGSIEIDSAPGQGTRITARLRI